MNLSQLMTRIKIECGIYMIALPFDNADQAIQDVIVNISRKTFSKFCPCTEEFRFTLDDLELLEKRANYEMYLLPDIFQSREIVSVREVRYNEADSSHLGYWGAGVPLLHGNMLNQHMLSNAAMALTNKVIPKMTFKFQHPRTVTLYNVLTSSHIVFVVDIEHDENLVTISPTMEESFFDLAVLDVKSMLYNSLKHYTDIQTAYGNISLKIEDWQQASEQRKTLVDQWRSTYHMDIIPFEYG